MPRVILELSQWGDGTMRLARWDNVNGHDTILVINQDGTISQAGYADDNSEDETLTPVDLVQALSGLLEK